MAVAYAVALQILLTSVLVSQNVGAMVSADPARVDIICFGASGGDGGADQGNGNHVARQNCCVLCSGTVGVAAIGRRRFAAAHDVWRRGSVRTSRRTMRRRHLLIQRPRLSQGPPQNA